MSLDKQEVQDICGHTALSTGKWSGFLCKRVSGDVTLSRYRSAEERSIRKKEKNDKS